MTSSIVGGRLPRADCPRPSCFPPVDVREASKMHLTGQRNGARRGQLAGPIPQPGHVLAARSWPALVQIQ
eukprot:2652017-Prorocentrum_lima.AAC.1